MASSTSNLQYASLVVHEAKIHDVVYDDIGPKIARKWHWCLSKSIDWRSEKVVGRWGFSVWWICKETFEMCAMLFCTINDFPAYGNLSDYSVKGHHAFPICEEDTSFIQLKHGRKIVYTRNRRFLKPYHPYRQLKKLLMEVKSTKLHLRICKRKGKPLYT